MDIVRYIADIIENLRDEHPLLVGFDGVDAAGKSTLADAVSGQLRRIGLSPLRVSIDSFCNPRHIRLQLGDLSPEGYFLHSFNYAKLIELVIQPVKIGRGTLTPGFYDCRTEELLQPARIQVGPHTVVLLDGVFLHRDELYQVWDLSVYLDIGFKTMLRRVLRRDAGLFGSRQNVEHRYRSRYIPGQALYIRQCEPMRRASIVIQNDDYQNPILVRGPQMSPMYAEVRMSENVVIREMMEADAPGIHAVALEAWRYAYRTIFDSQFIENFVNRNYAPEALFSLLTRIHSGSMFFHVAESDSKVVGFCNIGINQSSAELYRIYLLPTFIGQGIGRRLLEKGEVFLAEHGVNSYFCFVHKDNEIGKRFYLNSGFKHISEKDKEDEWFMKKELPVS